MGILTNSGSVYTMGSGSNSVLGIIPRRYRLF
jgi:hypothetical protein